MISVAAHRMLRPAIIERTESPIRNYRLENGNRLALGLCSYERCTITAKSSSGAVSIDTIVVVRRDGRGRQGRMGGGGVHGQDTESLFDKINVNRDLRHLLTGAWCGSCTTTNNNINNNTEMQRQSAVVIQVARAFCMAREEAARSSRE